jgi:hypothetical protein
MQNFLGGVSIRARVIYDYEGEDIPVPEPGALALFIVGIVGLALSGQRRRTSVQHSAVMRP